MSKPVIQPCSVVIPIERIQLPVIASVESFTWSMARFPITQVQWRSVAMLPQVDRVLSPDPSRFKGDQHPVENVSWWDAVEFCQRLSRATGELYRLPLEAEWEYACRAGTTTEFCFGRSLSPQLANYQHRRARSENGTTNGTTPVGQFPANAFGLYDMHGNVWEWCADADHSHRVLRGGSWFNGPQVCRSTSRLESLPSCRLDNVGFRVVCLA